MESILRDLYYGNLAPSERPVARLEEHRRLCERQLRQYNAFLQSLEPYQRKEFNKIIDHQFETIPMEYADAFVCGFQMGGKMMLEIFQEELTGRK